MNYKHYIGMAAIGVVLTTGFSGCEKVPAGYRGVIVNLYGSDKGVAEQSVGVGRYWLGWNSNLYLFPTFLQNYSWKDDQAIVLQTSEGLSIRTDAGITYRIQPDNVVKVFQKYRLGIDEITNTFLHNMVRDAMNAVASMMTVEQIYGAQKGTFIGHVNDIVKKEAAENGIEVDKIYLVGSFDLPPTVVNSINSKIQASQNAMKVENEVATARAEAQKTVVEAQAKGQQILINAESQAKANKILAESLTPEFVQYQTILKWNGELPKMTGNSAIPFINVKGN
ncbi:MAG TPA: SPFH domain-containing protein [Chitinophagaceae bacterium]|nr:SPFH domain-containing protein [Chitinophagaceae bacterium]